MESEIVKSFLCLGVNNITLHSVHRIVYLLPRFLCSFDHVGSLVAYQNMNILLNGDQKLFDLLPLSLLQLLLSLFCYMLRLNFLFCQRLPLLLFLPLLFSLFPILVSFLLFIVNGLDTFQLLIEAVYHVVFHVSEKGLKGDGGNIYVYPDIVCIYWVNHFLLVLFFLSFFLLHVHQEEDVVVIHMTVPVAGEFTLEALATLMQNIYAEGQSLHTNDPLILTDERRHEYFLHKLHKSSNSVQGLYWQYFVHNWKLSQIRTLKLQRNSYV